MDEDYDLKPIYKCAFCNLEFELDTIFLKHYNKCSKKQHEKQKEFQVSGFRPVIKDLYVLFKNQQKEITWMKKHIQSLNRKYNKKLENIHFDDYFNKKFPCMEDVNIDTYLELFTRVFDIEMVKDIKINKYFVDCFEDMKRVWQKENRGQIPLMFLKDKKNIVFYFEYGVWKHCNRDVFFCMLHKKIVKEQIGKILQEWNNNTVNAEMNETDTDIITKIQEEMMKFFNETTRTQIFKNAWNGIHKIYEIEIKNITVEDVEFVV